MMNEQIFDKKKSFVLAVKNNLRSFLRTADYVIDEYGSFTRTDSQGIKHLTLTELCNSLEKKSMREGNSYKLNKPEDKLKKMLSNENDSIDPYFVNEICGLYGFPIELVYRVEPLVTTEEAENIMAQYRIEESIRPTYSVPLSIETHFSYFGEFYGYTFDHNARADDRMIEFTLNIYEDEQHNPKAEYTFFNKSGEKYVFTGVPRFIPKLYAVYIEMTANNDRRFQYLYFNGFDYKTKKKLVYKNGVCVRTSTTSNNYEPDVKSFIITGRKMPKEIAEAIVPGLLKLCGNEFYMLSSQFNKLISEDHVVQDFCDAYRNDIEIIDGAVCLVKERKILESLNYEVEKDRIMGFECLAKMRKYSLAPNKAIYRVCEADYNYFYNLFSL